MQDPNEIENKMIGKPPIAKEPDPLTAPFEPTQDPREAGMSIMDIEARRAARNERDRNIELAMKASKQFQGDDVRKPPKPDRYTAAVPVILSTHRGLPFKVPRGYSEDSTVREIHCNKQVVVDQRTLRMLRGFQHRGVIQLIVGDVSVLDQKTLSEAAAKKPVARFAEE